MVGAAGSHRYQLPVVGSQVSAERHDANPSTSSGQALGDRTNVGRHNLSRSPCTYP